MFLFLRNASQSLTVIPDKDADLQPSRVFLFDSYFRIYCYDRNLMTTGEIFNPFGYAFAFRKGNITDHMAFSQAIQYIKELGVVEQLDA